MFICIIKGTYFQLLGFYTNVIKYAIIHFFKRPLQQPHLFVCQLVHRHCIYVELNFLFRVLPTPDYHLPQN